MTRTILALAVLVMPVVAEARPADCLLVVNGKTVIDGPCDFDPLPPSDDIKKGSFQITAGDRFALVNILPSGRALGFYNEFPGSLQPSGRLGPMSPTGACWQNDLSKICAWKPGERAYLSGQVSSDLKSFNGHTTTIGEERPKFNVTAPQLWREFNQNEPAAMDKYSNAAFSVEGTVVSVRYGRPGMSQKDQIYVELIASTYGDSVRVFLDDSVSGTAKQIQTSKPIRFICITAMKAARTIEVIGCR